MSDSANCLPRSTEERTYELLSRLSDVQPSPGKDSQWLAICPGHDDSKPSLSIGVGRDGQKLVLHCFAGCKTPHILKSLNLPITALFPDRPNRSGNSSRGSGSQSGQSAGGKKSGKVSLDEAEIVAKYDYTNAAGELLYQVVRFEPKDFRQRRPKADGKPGWIWSVKDFEKVPYRLPSLAQSPTAATVWIVEGEKDADTLSALGLVATTNAGGAGKWLSPFGPHLKGRNVVIVPDNDDAGRQHAKDVAGKLEDFAASIKILQLELHEPIPVKGDVSDWLKSGGSAERLVELAAVTPEWEKSDRLLPVFEESRTDLASAKRLVALHGHNIRHCWPWKKWLIWDGMRWVIDDNGGIIRLAKDAAIDTWKKTSRHPLTDETAIRYALNLSNHRALNSAIELAKSEPGIPIAPSELDADPWLLNCPNGTLDLRTGELRPHSPADKITKLCPTSYDPSAWAQTWTDTLEAAFDSNREIVEFVQRWLGYSLTGDVREQMMVVAWGGGSNGKSTILNTFTDVLGRDFAIAVDRTVIASLGGSQPRGSTTELMDLAGVRFAIASETEDGQRLHESLVKSLTGDDSIRGRRLFQDSWEFRPTHKLILATNHLPTIQGNDHAIWRRLAFLPFTQTFWNAGKGETGPDHLQADLGLKQKLQAEREGILNWCVQGCLDWLANGLNVPAEIRLATEQFRKDQDLIGSFLEANCSIAAGFNVRSSELFHHYRSWCETNGEKELSQTAFGKRMAEKGFDRFKSNGVWYRGLCVKRAADMAME